MKIFTDATPFGRMISEAELEAEESTRSLRDILDDIAVLTRELKAKLDEENK